MNKIISSPSQTKAVLAKYDLFAKKNLGQNFIIESGIVEKIARIAIKDNNYKVIEIGPGIGALTQYLCEYAKKVVAFEIDQRLPVVLEDTLQEYNNLELVIKDFLKVDISKVVDELREDGSEVVLVANLPYYITTPILFHLFESNAKLAGIYVMMQKEVGDRFYASVNASTYNALSIIAQRMYTIKQEMKVAKSVFMPKPSVDSVVVSFHTNKQCYSDNLGVFELIKACFKQRRKTLLNNLGEYLKDKEMAKLILKKAGIDPQLRAQACEWEVFERLYEVMDNEN